MNELLIGLAGAAATALGAVLAYRRGRKRDENDADKVLRVGAVEGFAALTRELRDLLTSERREWQERLDRSKEECIAKLDDLEERMREKIRDLENQLEAAGVPGRRRVSDGS